jgi:hypothetical protein
MNLNSYILKLTGSAELPSALELGKRYAKVVLSNSPTPALVDLDDYELVKDYRWHLDTNGYASTNIPFGDGKHNYVKMHRLILNTKSFQLVDHCNFNRLDNRRTNIRIASRAQKSSNRVRQRNNGSSIFKRVSNQSYKSLRSPWAVSIGFNGKQYHLGSFKEERHAALMHDFWADYFFGDYAQLNFTKVCSSTNAL